MIISFLHKNIPAPAQEGKAARSAQALGRWQAFPRHLFLLMSVICLMFNEFMQGGIFPSVSPSNTCPPPHPSLSRSVPLPPLSQVLINRVEWSCIICDHYNLILVKSK
jgi:hypothetical protein